jgi:hypothetical protein
LRNVSEVGDASLGIGGHSHILSAAVRGHNRREGEKEGSDLELHFVSPGIDVVVLYIGSDDRSDC